MSSTIVNPFCGPYIYTLTGITWDQAGSVNLGVYDFDTVDTFTIEGISSADYGIYTVSFDVVLQDYMIPAATTFTFEFEIVPDCAASIISSAVTISF